MEKFVVGSCTSVPRSEALGFSRGDVTPELCLGAASHTAVRRFQKGGNEAEFQGTFEGSVVLKL